VSDTSSLMVKGPEISPDLWTGSRKPWRGWLLCSGAALSVATAGVLVPVPAARYALFALAVVAFFAIPQYVLRLRLPRLAGEVDALSDKRAAQALQTRIREDFWVEQFAPSAWLPLQEARIQLVLEDGRAAARHFAEVARLGRAEDPKRRVEAARGHALLMAGDRKEAMAIFDELARRDVLEPLDELALGIVLLSEPARIEDAGRHLLAAHESLGDEYRVLAALALARERLGEPEGAHQLVERATELQQAGLEHDDVLAGDLLKRAKKGLRPWLRAQDKRDKKKGRRANKGSDRDEPTSTSARDDVTSSTVSPDGDASPAEALPGEDDLDDAQLEDDAARGAEDGSKKKKRKGKKARQQARREARKRKKAEERARKHEQTQLRIAAAKAGTEPSHDDATPTNEPETVSPPKTAAVADATKTPKQTQTSAAPVTSTPRDDAELGRPPLAASASTSGAAIPRPPALGFSGATSPDAPRPFAAPKVPVAAKPPPPSGSLFGSLDMPPRSATDPAKSRAPQPTSKPVTPSPSPSPSPPRSAEPTPKPVAKPAPPPPASAPFPDDLFAPPAATAGPPSVTAPVVPPPPVLGGSTGPAPKPSSVVDDAWGDLFDGPPVPGGPKAPLITPVAPPAPDDDAAQG